MPYCTDLATRLAEFCIQSHPYLEDKKMFGGIVWMLHGNMSFGIYKEWLIVRVGLENANNLLTQPHTKPMDFTGKVMKGWVMIAPAAIIDDAQFKYFVELAIDFVLTLPSK